MHTKLTDAGFESKIVNNLNFCNILAKISDSARVKRCDLVVGEWMIRWKISRKDFDFFARATRNGREIRQKSVRDVPQSCGHTMLRQKLTRLQMV